MPNPESCSITFMNHCRMLRTLTYLRSLLTLLSKQLVCIRIRKLILESQLSLPCTLMCSQLLNTISASPLRLELLIQAYREMPSFARSVLLFFSALILKCGLCCVGKVMRDVNRCVVVNPLRRRLFNSTTLSDVELVVEGGKWPAHAFVLAEGSQYFERMWTSELVEGQTKKVHIEGVNAQVMEIVLRYLYGCLDSLPVELVVPVVQAADRYEVSNRTQYS